MDDDELRRNSLLMPGVLREALIGRTWSQANLAEKAGIAPSVVSAQLSGHREIRDEHLNRYLTALNKPKERRRLLAAWIRDNLEPDVVEDVLARPRGKEPSVHPAVAEWDPALDEEQREMLQWWSSVLPRNRDLDDLFRSMARGLGFQPNEKHQPG